MLRVNFQKEVGSFNSFSLATKTLKVFAFGVFVILLWPACVMTRSQGDDLSGKMYKLENEVAKLQRVRHDLEVLLNDKVKDLFERIGTFESELSNLRFVLSENKDNYDRVLGELQRLQGEIDETKSRSYAMARSGNSAVPADRSEHLKAAEKAFSQKNWSQAIALFEQYQKLYPDENETLAYTYVQLGEALREQALMLHGEDKIRHLKKAVVSLQKSLSHLSNEDKKAEALLKVGMCLKDLNNTDGARAAFKELLDKMPNSKQSKDAKKLLAELGK